MFKKINLQLLADAGTLVNATSQYVNAYTGATTAFTTTETLVPENKVFYDKALIESAQPALIHDQFGQKRPIPANGGKQIEFRKFGALAKVTQALTEGVIPTGKKLSVTTISAVVSQYGDYVTISDVLDLTAIDKVVLEATKAIGRQAGLSLDTVVRNALQSGTNVMYAPTISGTTETAVTARSGLDSTAVLTVKLLQKAVAKLRAANAPTINGKYVGIIHPYAAYQLMRDPEWIDAHKYAQPAELYEGEIGEIAGVRFVQTTEAKIYTQGTGSSAFAVFGTLVLGENAYGVTEVEGGGLQTIIHNRDEIGGPLNQFSTVGWKALKVAEILQDTYIVRIEHCVTDFNTTAAN